MEIDLVAKLFKNKKTKQISAAISRKQLQKAIIKSYSNRRVLDDNYPKKAKIRLFLEDK